jgi:uncharacterized OB-fold protein
VVAVSPLPAPAPPVNEETAPFWAALGAGRLDLPVCDACRHHIWYPRDWCPVCRHEQVTWTTLSGRGTVYARTILHKAMGPWGAAAPFVIAYVELDEGPRVLTNVVTDDPATVDVGTTVEAVFAPVEDPREGSPATHLLRFSPTG